MQFDPLRFIETKRDARAHSRGELTEFVRRVCDGSMPDYQISAWLMAVVLNGMTDDELHEFTDALAHSGETVALPAGPPAVDKHSTGGVGDKTTLIVAPLAASCGLRVAKMSGRGLSYTGGTVDKLESIPGMNVHLTREQFMEQVERIGVAITGHSAELAPAEGKFYALRDVTATVPSLPLIGSSIVSKKVAGGADAFVFDVKCGSGAFMRTKQDASSLANVLNGLSRSMGRKSSCVITAMEQPLGEWVGGAVEVLEAVQVLSGSGPADTRELCVALAAEMLLVSGACSSSDEARGRAETALDSGAALRSFRRMVHSQHGDASVCDSPERVLDIAPNTAEIAAPRSGAVAGIDARSIGEALRLLGGGRCSKDDDIDLSVGIRLKKKTGDEIRAGEPIADVLYSNAKTLESALPLVRSAFSYADEAERPRLVLDLGSAPS